MASLRSMLRAPRAVSYWLGVGQHRMVEHGHDMVFLCHGTPRAAVERLARQLRYLRRAFRIVPLAALAASIGAPRPPGQPRAALVFDDGLRSNVTVAYPMLRALGIPATFFVCPGLIEERRWLWTHEARCRLHFAGRAPGQVEALVQRMKLLGHARRLRVEAALRRATAEFVPSAAEREAFDLASWDELRSLDPALVTVGSHSMTHPILPSLDGAGIEAELRDSRRLIEARLARTAEFFSYPNGDADERTLAGVRRHYRAAVRYQSASATDPHQIACTHLPRGVLSLAWDVNHP